MNVSKVLKKKFTKTQTGTPYYASPEVWRCEEYDFKTDVWSLGCVIFEICNLKQPFRAANIDLLYEKVQTGVSENWDLRYSKELRTLVSQCLELDFTVRPAAKALLKRPYFETLRAASKYLLKPKHQLPNKEDFNEMIHAKRISHSDCRESLQLAFGQQLGNVLNSQDQNENHNSNGIYSPNKTPQHQNEEIKIRSRQCSMDQLFDKTADDSYASCDELYETIPENLEHSMMVERMPNARYSQRDIAKPGPLLKTKHLGMEIRHKNHRSQHNIAKAMQRNFKKNKKAKPQRSARMVIQQTKGLQVSKNFRRSNISLKNAQIMKHSRVKKINMKKILFDNIGKSQKMLKNEFVQMFGKNHANMVQKIQQGRQRMKKKRKGNLSHRKNHTNISKKHPKPMAHGQTLLSDRNSSVKTNRSNLTLKSARKRIFNSSRHNNSQFISKTKRNRKLTGSRSQPKQKPGSVFKRILSHKYLNSKIGKRKIQKSGIGPKSNFASKTQNLKPQNFSRKNLSNRPNLFERHIGKFLASGKHRKRKICKIGTSQILSKMKLPKMSKDGKSKILSSLKVSKRRESNKPQILLRTGENRNSMSRSLVNKIEKRKMAGSRSLKKKYGVYSQISNGNVRFMDQNSSHKRMRIKSSNQMALSKIGQKRNTSNDLAHKLRRPKSQALVSKNKLRKSGIQIVLGKKTNSKSIKYQFSTREDHFPQTERLKPSKLENMLPKKTKLKDVELRQISYTTRSKCSNKRPKIKAFSSKTKNNLTEFKIPSAVTQKVKGPQSQEQADIKSLPKKYQHVVILNKELINRGPKNELKNKRRISRKNKGLSSEIKRELKGVSKDIKTKLKHRRIKTSIIKESMNTFESRDSERKRAFTFGKIKSIDIKMKLKNMKMMKVDENALSFKQNQTSAGLKSNPNINLFFSKVQKPKRKIRNSKGKHLSCRK